ncbi:MAG: YihY/virulence factor BrkB family protein [Alphaproteobacteria bacterium]
MKSNLVKDGWFVISDAAGHFSSDDGWAMASHVALSGLMAVFPFIIFVAAVAGFMGEEALTEQVADLLFRTWPEQVAGPIAAEVKRVVAQSGGSLLTVSAVVAFFLASNGVEAARSALNRAYRVVEPRSIFWLRGQSLLFVFLGAALCLLFAFLGLVASQAFDWVAGLAPWLRPLQTRLTVTGLTGTVVVVVGALISAHLWLPAGRPPARELWPGVILTLVLWLVGAYAFTLYLSAFSNMATTYAGLAGVVTAIFFLYIIAVILIFGAEFNASLRRLRQEKARSG